MSNTPSSWGSPDSWDKPISFFSKEQQHNKIQSRLAQNELKNSWGNPNAWNHQSANTSAISNKKQNSWGNPFGWPTFLGGNPNHSVPAKKEPQSMSNWGTATQSNWGQGVQPDSSAWGTNSNNAWPRPASELKGDLFFQFLKERQIDDEVICILATQGVNTLQVLRQCSQEALAVKGIKLNVVIKLKSL